MQPFFGPDREEALELLRGKDAVEHLPITLGDGMPSYVIDTHDDRWVLIPLQLDEEAAHRVGQQAAVDSGLWSWDFLQRGDPIYATPSKSEFVRWLEVWSWLGTGVPRAAPQTSDEVTACELEFENLMRGDRLIFSWARSPDAPALETLHATVETEGATYDEQAQIPAHLWSEFVDVLREHTFETVPMPGSADADSTRPDLIVSQRLLREVEGVRPEPAGRTVDGLNLDPARYVACTIRLAIADEGRVECRLEKAEAHELREFVIAFAADYGLEHLPSDD